MPRQSTVEPALTAVVPMSQFYEMLVFGVTEVFSAALCQFLRARITFGICHDLLGLIGGQFGCFQIYCRKDGPGQDS